MITSEAYVLQTIAHTRLPRACVHKVPGLVSVSAALGVRNPYRRGRGCSMKR